MRQRTGVTPGREEKSRVARRLRGEGLKYTEIAEQMGVSRSYASQLVIDPDGSKGRALKDSYGGTCVYCGSRTSGANGTEAAAEVCGTCFARRQHEERGWTRETTLEGLREYVRRFGRQPVSSEILVLRPGSWCPNVATVLREFGTWQAAMKELGFESRVGIKYGHSKRGDDGMSSYKVLEQNGSGTWHERGEVIATTQAGALKKYLEDADVQEGRFLCIPAGTFVPRRIRLVMKPVLEVVRDE